MAIPVRRRDEILADPIAAWDELEAGITFLEEEINAKDSSYVVTPFVAGQRTSTWIMTKTEIQGLEDRMHAVSAYLGIPHIRTVWSGLMPVNYNAMNHFILGLAPQQWIDEGFDWDGSLDALMPDDYSFPDIDWLGMFNGTIPVDPLTDLIEASVPTPSVYLYAGGATTQKVFKVSPELSKIAESANYGGEVRALASDGTYIYAAGDTTNKIYKYDPTDMSKVAESADYGGWINKLLVLGSYLYAAGKTTNKIYKYQLSDLAKVAESPSYGTEITSLCTDGVSIFAAGWYSTTYTRKVCKYSAETLNFVRASAGLPSGIEGLASDGISVYVSSSAEIYKLAASDLTQIGVDYGSESGTTALLCDGGYLYACGAMSDKLRKIDIASMTEADAYVTTGNIVNSMAINDGYIYLAGSDVDGADTKIIRVATATMEIGSGSCDYGGIPGALIFA